MSKKITGYTAVLHRNGVIFIITVKARSKEGAMKLFQLGDLDIHDTNHIVKTCMIKFPGPPNVKRMKEVNLRKCKPIIP